MSLLKQEYKAMDLVEAKKLALKVLSKTLDVKLSPEKSKDRFLFSRSSFSSYKC